MKESTSWFSERLADFAARATPVEVPTTGTAGELVRVATPLFGARGFDGVSVREITAAANANLGAITYHFGSKQGLFDAVLVHALAPLVERVRGIVAGPGTPLERVEAVARAYFLHLREHPSIPGLMMRVMLADRPPAAIGPTLAAMLGALARLVAEGQADGSMRAGDPALMGMGVLSVPIHLNLVQRPLHAFAGVDLSDPATRERMAEHAAAFVRAAVEAR